MKALGRREDRLTIILKEKTFIPITKCFFHSPVVIRSIIDKRSIGAVWPVTDILLPPLPIPVLANKIKKTYILKIKDDPSSQPEKAYLLNRLILF